MITNFWKTWLLLIPFLSCPCVAHAAESGISSASINPLSLYGDELRFDVLRNGKKRGWHLTQFNGQNDELVVKSQFRLRIDFLFLNAFRYHYVSEALWRKGQLFHLKSETDDNGKISNVKVSRSGGDLWITAADQNYSVLAPLFPTNHWHSGVIHESRVINTITGRLNYVDIERIARENVATENGLTEATRYIYTGDLETEVWYDDLGRWVKMRFLGKDGSTIEYLCQRCQNGSTEGVDK